MPLISTLSPSFILNKITDELFGAELIFTLSDFRIPWLILYLSKIEKDPENIKKLLIDQIFSTVKWRETIINISNEGVSNFVEIGPGKVLTGMVKRTVKNANCFSINSVDDIKNLKNEFKK